MKTLKLAAVAAIALVIGGCTRSICSTQTWEGYIRMKLAAVAAIALVIGGCMRSIEIVKEGENGYTVKYLNLGLKTDVSSISAEKSQGGEIKVKITGLTTDISGESKEIVTSAGSAVGKVAEAVIPAK